MALVLATELAPASESSCLISSIVDCAILEAFSVSSETSFGSGFLACSALKPGGGNGTGALPVEFEVSVE